MTLDVWDYDNCNDSRLIFLIGWIWEFFSIGKISEFGLPNWATIPYAAFFQSSYFAGIAVCSRRNVNIFCSQFIRRAALYQLSC